MKTNLRSLIVATLLFSGSVNAIGSSSNSRAVDPVAQTRDKWLAAFKPKDVTRAVAFYASDAAFLQPTGVRIEGSKAIRELYEKVVSTFDTDLTLTSRFLEASGRLACDSGKYEETLTNRATAQKEHYRGQYVMVFRLGPDGEWRIIQHVGSVVPARPN
jgi:ketosteroid isomerase-like protein